MVMTHDPKTNEDPLLKLEQDILEDKLPEVCDFTGCGRRFKNRHALAMHRNKSHGIKSETRNASKKRTVRKKRRPVAEKVAEPALQIELHEELDVDALLGIVFPRGMRVDEGTLEMTRVWLDAARELHSRGA